MAPIIIRSSPKASARAPRAPNVNASGTPSGVITVRTRRVSAR
jgi:hypothetical protein